MRQAVVFFATLDVPVGAKSRKDFFTSTTLNRSHLSCRARLTPMPSRQHPSPANAACHLPQGSRCDLIEVQIRRSLAVSVLHCIDHRLEPCLPGSRLGYCVSNTAMYVLPYDCLHGGPHMTCRTYPEIPSCLTGCRSLHSSCHSCPRRHSRPSR